VAHERVKIGVIASPSCQRIRALSTISLPSVNGAELPSLLFLAMLRRTCARPLSAPTPVRAGALAAEVLLKRMGRPGPRSSVAPFQPKYTISLKGSRAFGLG
jgi:hypothetical protein